MGRTGIDPLQADRLVPRDMRGASDVQTAAPAMLKKHSATLHGHRTSFSLEDVFWQELKAIAAARAVPVARLIAEIDDARPADSNLSSALRVHVLAWVKSQGANTSPPDRNDAGQA